MSVESPERTVVVASFRSPAEAEQALREVTAAGIDARVGGDAILGAGWLSLAVRANDAEGALRIVQSLWPEEAALLGEPAELCPRCASTDTAGLPRLLILGVAALVLISLGFALDEIQLFALTLLIAAVLLFVVPNRRCRACGERWRGHRPAEPDHPHEPPVVRCPRCGSEETFAVDRRKQKAITMLVNMALPPLVVIWPFLPKLRCADCGHEWR